MPNQNDARAALDVVYEYINRVDGAAELLPFVESDQHNEIQALAEYAQQTGHRLVVDYRNPHGRPTENRRVVVQKIRVGGTTHRTYLDTIAWPGGAPRTFILDRINSVSLDGVPS